MSERVNIVLVIFSTILWSYYYVCRQCCEWEANVLKSLRKSERVNIVLVIFSTILWCYYYVCRQCCEWKANVLKSKCFKELKEDYERVNMGSKDLVIYVSLQWLWSYYYVCRQCCEWEANVLKSLRKSERVNIVLVIFSTILWSYYYVCRQCCEWEANVLKSLRKSERVNIACKYSAGLLLYNAIMLLLCVQTVLWVESKCFKELEEDERVNMCWSSSLQCYDPTTMCADSVVSGKQMF